MDGSYLSLEALPIEHLQIVFVASSSCSEDDTTTATPAPSTTAASSPVCQQRPSANRNSGLANGHISPVLPKVHDVKTKAKRLSTKMATSKRVLGRSRDKSKKVEIDKKVAEEEEVLDAPPDGWPLRRVISIEEDHLPHLLQGGPQPLLHQLSEEEDERDEEEEDDRRSDLSASPRYISLSKEAPPARKSYFTQSKKTPPVSPRGQPVGKETSQVCLRLPTFIYAFR